MKGKRGEEHRRENRIVMIKCLKKKTVGETRGKKRRGKPSRGEREPNEERMKEERSEDEKISK